MRTAKSTPEALTAGCRTRVRKVLRDRGVPVLVGEEPVVADIGMPSPACSTARARTSSATAAYTNLRQSRTHSVWIVMSWAALAESRDRSVST